MAKVDPWDIDPKETEKKRKEYTGGSKGIPCPKRNLIGDKTCKVCDQMKLWWDKPAGSPERETYQKKKVSFSFFMNVVFEHDKTKSVILEVGKNAGDVIISSIQDSVKNWRAIAHPKAGKGLITCIKKFKKDGNNSYDVYVKTDRPDWDVPDDVIANLPSLEREDIIRMIDNDELTDSNYMKISSLKMDETLPFRICPHWDEERRSTPPLEFLARHWWTTEDEITGKAAITAISDSIEPESKSAFNEKSEAPSGNKESNKKLEPQQMKCFGDKTFFSVDDDDCKECVNFDPCKTEIKKQMKQ